VLPFDSFFQIFKFNFLLKSNFYVIIYLNLTKNTIYQYFGYRRGSVNSANESLKQFNDDVYEIDLKALFIKIKILWYFVVVCALAGGILGLSYFTFLSTPHYQSSSMVYLRSSDKKISLESLQLSSNLTSDYEIIFTSRPNLEAVINKLSLKYTTKQLNNMIKIENPQETRILKISVTSDSATEAMKICNALVEEGMDDIREIDSQEPYRIEKAIVNNERVGLNRLKSTALGGLIGMLLCLGYITLRFVLDDAFTSVEDVEATLDLPVLAVVVDDKALKYVKKSRKKRGKK
jgi:capsular polysaccharide biosynthesis protein